MGNYKDRDWLYEQYVTLKKTLEVIADSSDTSRRTIAKWLDKFGIEMRSAGESNSIRHIAQEIPKKKKCGKCKRNRLIKFFYTYQRKGSDKISIGGKCKECHIEIGKKYYPATNDRKKKRKYLVLSHYSGGQPKCACCEEKNIEFLQLDHKNNDGNEHRKLMNGIRGSKIYYWCIINGFPEIFRVLCANCNFSKGAFGYCPHRNLPEDKIIQ